MVCQALEFVIAQSDIVAVVCVRSQVQKFIAAQLKCPCIKKIVIIEDSDSMNPASVASTNSSSVQTTGDAELFYEFEVLEARGLQAVIDGTARTLSGAGVGLPSWFGLHDPIDTEIEEKEPHTLLYTSGTTGRPKGVSVSKKRWLRDAESNGFAGFFGIL